MRKKINITYVTSSLKIGGAETILYKLLKNLNPELFTGTVLYFHDGPFKEKIAQLGIKTYHITGSLYRYDPLFFIHFNNILQKLKPHIIHSSLWAANFFSAFSARYLSIPTICSLHALREHEGLLRRTLDRISLPWSTHFVAASKSIAQSFITDYPQANNQLTVIPNALDTQILDIKKRNSCITRAQLGLSVQDFVIGSVGRFVPVKNYDLLLSCFAQILPKYPKFTLVLVGSGPEYQTLKAQAQNLNIHHKVYFILDQDAQDYYQLFDIFIQPSHYEGLSLALLEALYFQLPCIVTGTSKQHEVITHNTTGLIISPNNASELINILEYAYVNYNLMKDLAYAGFKLVQNNYQLSPMIENYAALFTKIAKISQ